MTAQLSLRRLGALAALLLAVLLSGCEFSLAGDVTPPPEAEISSVASTPLPVEYPPAAANLQSGAVLFSEHCAACHGPRGLGDGAQAGQLPVQPAAIGTSTLADAARPADWYLTITQGNLDNFMPPFANQLSLQQRWDVLAYVYSLSQDELASQAEPLFSQHADALRAALPLDDIRAMAAFSRHELVATLEQSLPSLSSAELVALAGYVQARALGGSTQAAEGSAPPASGRLRGQVQDGSDGQLAPGLAASLFGYEGQTLVYTDSVPLAADGSFAFDSVPAAPGRTFFASVDYLGLSYFSEFVTDPAQTQFAQPITVYETTSDTDQLAIERLTLILEFDAPGVMRVVPQYVLSNIGSRAVTPRAENEPVLLYSLPEGASNLAFNEGSLGERYLPSAQGFGDLRAVLPGLQSYQLLFAYQMPYTRNLDLPLALDLPVRAVVVLVQAGSVSLANADFTAVGQQEIEGRVYDAYLSTAGYSAGQAPALQLRGRNPQGGAGWQSLLASDTVISGLAVLTAAVGVAWLWLRHLQRDAQQLLAQIARLDERHARGEIAEGRYQRQRSALKAQLQRVLKR